MPGTVMATYEQTGRWVMHHCMRDLNRCSVPALTALSVGGFYRQLDQPGRCHYVVVPVPVILSRCLGQCRREAKPNEWHRARLLVSIPDTEILWPASIASLGGSSPQPVLRLGGAYHRRRPFGYCA